MEELNGLLEKTGQEIDSLRDSGKWREDKAQYTKLSMLQEDYAAVDRTMKLLAEAEPVKMSKKIAPINSLTETGAISILTQKL